MMAYLLLIGAFLANGVANTLLKLGADKGIRIDWSLGIGGLIAHHAFLIAGTALFVVNLGLYVAALRLFPLSVAYPVMVGMSFVVASSAAVLFLGEPLSWQHLLGYVLILTGITVVVGYANS